ncbi:MAG: M20 family metallopeptidase [Candidatus Helarchaeota archaeon]
MERFKIIEEKEILSNIDSEEIITLCQKLIQTNSINPPGNEYNVARVISNFLKENGIDCEIFDMGNNRANLIATLRGNGNKKLLLNGHMDVVPIENDELWIVPPLSGIIKRKRIIGRGAADMKGALAAMIIAFVTLKRIQYPLKGDLILNCVADEETLGMIGTKWCIENQPDKMKADAVIVCEPSGLDPLPKAILLGEKGRVEIKLVAHGISCHAGMPALGVNPIKMLIEILSNLDKLYSYIQKVVPPFSKEELKTMLSEGFVSKEVFERIYNENPILQSLIDALCNFTFAITMIDAGIKENVVPKTCEAVIDFRLIPNQTPDNLIDGIKNFIEDLGYQVKNPKDAKEDETFIELITNSTSEPSIIDKLDYEIIDILFHTYKDIYGKNPFKFLMPATTDARFFRNSGFCKQVIVFGPGNATRAHGINENIEIKDLINATKTYALVAARFLK